MTVKEKSLLADGSSVASTAGLSDGTDKQEVGGKEALPLPLVR